MNRDELHRAKQAILINGSFPLAEDGAINIRKVDAILRNTDSQSERLLILSRLFHAATV